MNRTFLSILLNLMTKFAEINRNGRVKISPKSVINGDVRLSGFQPLL